MINDLCDGVYVFPEVKFTVELFLAYKYGREITGAQLHDLIIGDPRISAMGISEENLAAVCLRHSSNDPAALLIDLATAKMGRKPAGIVIKHEKLAYLLETVEAALPQVRYLHIVRDPRAVANSMLNTPVPEKPGFNMGRGSILYPARHWRHYIKRLKDWAASHPVIEIRYEDLQKDSGRSACCDIASALGTRLRSSNDTKPQPIYQTAAIDQALHAKIHDGFDERRTSGWRDELTSRHIRLVEATCGADMESFGYRLMTHHKARVSVVLASLMHNGVMVHHATRSLLHHLRRGDSLRAMRMQAALLRSKSQLMSRRPSA